ncbi:MAG: hypothetical protein AJITA_00627 [Acetilactobacillus jinshanensis]
MNDIEPISLENEVNTNETLLHAMHRKAEQQHIKLMKGFWNSHEPLGVVKDSLLYKGLVLYYYHQVGNFQHEAEKRIHGFLNNNSPEPDKHFGFYFHAKADTQHSALPVVVFATLLKHVGTITDFMKFINQEVGFVISYR